MKKALVLLAFAITPALAGDPPQNAHSDNAAPAPAPAPVAHHNAAPAPHVGGLPNQSRGVNRAGSFPIARTAMANRPVGFGYQNYQATNWRRYLRTIPTSANGRLNSNLPNQNSALQSQPLAIAQPPRTSPDTADDILRTVRRRPDHPGQEGTRPTPDNVTGTNDINTKNHSPDATTTPPATPAVSRNHGNGSPVVSFNNHGAADWNDACRRHRGHHDHDWWCHNFSTIILIGGCGYYAWDSGWWYPAYGYDPYYTNYTYDGPIFGYDGLPPDQVIANVQGVLQEMGYFPYAVDGVLGPVTRQAIAAYQTDNGLFVTGAIDRELLVSLGFIL